MWQIGTGYFGCRTPDGRFDLARLVDTVAGAPIRAIEIKLSQGAKPGKGGVLLGAKVLLGAMAALVVGHFLGTAPIQTGLLAGLSTLAVVAAIKGRDMFIGKARRGLGVGPAPAGSL